MLVSFFVTVTWTPARTAPVASEIVPEMKPRVSWAEAERTGTDMKRARKITNVLKTRDLVTKTALQASKPFRVGKFENLTIGGRPADPLRSPHITSRRQK